MHSINAYFLYYFYSRIYKKVAWCIWILFLLVPIPLSDSLRRILRQFTHHPRHPCLGSRPAIQPTALSLGDFDLPALTLRLLPATRYLNGRPFTVPIW